MRVMLVAPPGRCTPGGSFQAVPPEGLSRLVTWLRQECVDVAVIDLLIEGYDIRVAEGRTVRYGLSSDAATLRIADWSPDVIGLSCPFTCSEPDVLDIARACKSVMPKTPIVVGGAHAAVTAVSLLEKERAVDFVALSEGEPALSTLLACIRDRGDPGRVSGFATRLEDGSVQERPLDRFLDPDQLPVPAWDLFPVDAYAAANAPHFGVGSGKRYLTTSWSRGCVNACSYCLSPRVWGSGNYRKRSVQRILDEVRHLRDSYGIEELHVQDNCLLADKGWFHSVLDTIRKECPGVFLDFSNALDANELDRATADRMARAGTVRLALSFETGDPIRRLRWSAKQVPLRHGQELLAALRSGGIETAGYFMLGFPSQTIAEMHATVEYALSLEFDAVGFFIATPFPGTPLYAFCDREGLLVHPLDYRDFRFSTGLIRTKEFGPEDTERIRREGWEAFHRRCRSQV